MNIPESQASVAISIQYAIPEKIPPKKLISEVIRHTLTSEISSTHRLHIGVRIVSAEESAALNQTYRQKTGPTNVLAFPFVAIPGFQGLAMQELGDLVICAAVVIQEAEQQLKSVKAHFTHLLIHGVLHLLGHDHIIPEDAARMEAREIVLLQELGYANPYEEDIC